MKLVAQNYKSGELSVLDVPVPACKPGGVLVASAYSLISTGTEMMKVTEAKLSLLGKARQRPDQVRKVVDSVAQVGPVAAYQKVVNRLDSYTPLGYSLCGVVVEVGAGAEELSVGDRVACAGNEHALHAEVNWVPTNLCARVPHDVDSRHAAFATVGAIAMHGVRQAQVQLGETACVIGLGLVGQLVTQLLVAAGVRVVGVDPVPDRVALARTGGAVAGAPPSAEGIAELEQTLVDLTGGAGCDHIFLAAGGSSNDPVHLAARLARDRARVVDIGKCRLDLPWNEYYDKELDVRFSRSYGPGRYDDSYEIEGIDYPIGYVRWTERRNLACFLDLARERLRLEPLISEVSPIEDAAVLYERLGKGELRGVGFLLAYPERAAPAPAPRPARDPAPAPAPPPALAPLRRPLRLGFVGAGSYATSMLLPHLAANEAVQLARVATTTSLSAANAQRRFSFADASTDTAAVLDDDSIDAVFIVTRHRTHADLTCQALERGKTVFVEKPLALSRDELQRVSEVIEATGNDRLMVGFNRRFSPMFVDLRARFGATGASLVRYLVSAGRLDAKSWYGNTAAEGSRFEGEGGHFIDTVSWWLDALPTEVHALSTEDPDDLLVNLRFDDGSIASIAYATKGNARFPKETFEASAGGRTARLANFRSATVWSGRRRTVKRSLASIDKGQRAEVQAFVDAVRSGGPMPIPLASLLATTRATLAVSASRASRRPESV